MKRSEMVERLRMQLDYMELSSDKDAMFNWESSRPINTREIEEIIDFLENNGMLPPPTCLENVTGIIKYYHCHNEIEEDTDYHTNPAIFWEPEDV